ncbi:MAG: hypothetical protein O3A82_00470 [Verrucomicrobia bacterium]|nr:hypothetical protein [Verrucomicrobiota bacterium]MDA0723897.1 hypothetical protein [Verrucomicrobiota bacterium]MDA1045385.1 hypothetical protein [Verrucomicrobiota bacterium]
MNWLNKPFSHIYIEHGAKDYPTTIRIIESFPRAEIIFINNYKEVFNRRNQSFAAQKLSQKLILAKKKSDYIYDGSHFVQEGDEVDYFYTALMLNCLYDCSYCYLQGMFSSANLVQFVNLEDYFSSITDFISKRENKQKPVLLSISHDCDLLAFEKVSGVCREWIRFLEDHSGFDIEIRTKSANFSAIQDLPPNDRVLLAWTLSPHAVGKSYEKGAPVTRRRIEDALMAASHGWGIRLCFDPVIPVEGWREGYSDLINEIFCKFPMEQLRDVTVGTFRMNGDYFRRMAQARPTEELVYRDFEHKNGVVSHTCDERLEINDFMTQQLLNYVPEDKIRTWS